MESNAASDTVQNPLRTTKRLEMNGSVPCNGHFPGTETSIDARSGVDAIDKHVDEFSRCRAGDGN
jgi:hypothetical protein